MTRKNKPIPSYYTVNWDFNHDNIEYFDIMPYLVNEWNNEKKKKHKLWAMWVNSTIESEDYALAIAKNKKITYPKAKELNLSKKKYLDDTKMPETFEEFKTFVKDRCFCQFWARCEYEVIVTGWPQQKHEHKLDVYQQVKANLDVVTKHFMDYINS